MPDGAARIGPGLALLRETRHWLPAVHAVWPGWRPVRAGAFDKTAAQNWSVPWHQDRVIAMAERLDVPGFSNWSDRSGYWHCSPSLDVLEDMLFVRVHLDASLRECGGMQIAVGSHSLGHIRAGDVDTTLATCRAEDTDAAPGDILVLHMLTLHRSCPSQTAVPRRVIRFDLARKDLPGGLRWAVDDAVVHGTPAAR
ncbi:MAG: phytanoyl-CoA dioxygenase family protein [Pseudomonadota bacterium]